MKNTQESTRFCSAYLRTMDPERAAAESGQTDGYTMLGKKSTQRELARIRRSAAAQLTQEDILRKLAQLAFGQVEDTVRLALCRGEADVGTLDLSAISELRVTEKGVEVKLVDRIRVLETLWNLLDSSESRSSDPLYQALAGQGAADGE